MIYKKLTKKHYILILIATLIVLLLVGGIWFALNNSKKNSKPNPAPGSEGAKTSTKKVEQEKEQKEQAEKLKNILANTPKDKKSVCIATSKFSLEQRHQEILKQIEESNQRMIKRLTENDRPTQQQEYTKNNQIKRENARHQKNLDNIKCND